MGESEGRSPSARIDALLLLMTVIWGTNYALIKSAFREIDPQAFNALRLVLASIVMAATSLLARRWTLHDLFHTPAPVTRGDWLRLAGVGLVGHCLYQYLLAGGLARTSVANGALLVSLTPVVISGLSALSGHERPGLLHWAGTLVSLLGVYVIIGHDAHVTTASLRGDVMLMGAVLCWALYTMGTRRLMERHSPVGVTALSMLIGTAAYLPIAAPSLARVPWASVGPLTWLKLVYSAIFSICVAYTIWYAAVRAIGSARTAVYSNLMPIVAMATAWVWLREPVGRTKLLGAAAVLAGVAVARMRVFGRTMEAP